jgi:methenyltetrahydrofolate cyclohydrolase
VTDLAKQSVERFLDAVASDAPAPGGGSSAAVAAALGAALVEMAAKLADRADAVTSAEELRRRAMDLAEHELTSYAPVLAARSDEERVAALAVASEAPAQVAEVAAEVAQRGLDVAAASTPAVRGDALTGVTLAEAAASAAARLVAINLGSGELVERAQRAERRALKARASATNDEH